MIFYAGLMVFIVLLWLVLIKFEYKPRVKIYCTIVGLVLFGLMAFKGSNVGNDTPVYIALYQQLSQTANLLDNPTRYEIGYVIYSKLIALIFNHYQFLFIVTSILVTISLMILIIKNSSMIWLSLYLLVSLRFYYFFLSGIRQTIAIAIVCLSYEYIQQRKPIVFFLLIALATLFHNSAILFLIAYPVYQWKFGLRGASVLLLATVAVYFLFNPVINAVLKLLPAYYTHYQMSVQFAENNLANFVNCAVILVFFALCVYSNNLNKNKVLDTNKSNELQAGATKDLSYYMLLAFCVAVISLKASMLDRLYMYFWIFGVIYIPNVISAMRDKKQAAMITYFVVVLTFAYNLIILYFRPNWNSIVPYTFFWQ